ncbi:MAG: hypothetical protein DIU78_004395 [Pseudomonadota bacterium]|nr:MAG: hypothetical protein DIU78_14040 [Pseudomonadota bacterium]
MAHRRFFWDFFGPHAEPTAAHFVRHLDEFLARNALTGCSTGTLSAGPGHHAAYCDAPADVGAAIERALRPRRSEPAPENADPSD